MANPERALTDGAEQAAADITTRQQEYPALQQFVNRAKPSHYHTPLVRAALQADVPIWLHGEAGSGKSTAGEQAADSLGLPFRSVSLGPTTSKSRPHGLPRCDW